MKKRVVIFTLLTLMAVIIITTIRCSSSKQTGAKLADSVITPVNLPVIVPGFNFPQDSATVYKWISPTYDSTSVYNHAWGIWAGLTAESGQTYQGDSLLVYQTWLGIGEIQSIVQNGPTSQLSLTKKTSRTLLTVPNQIKHAKAAGKLRGLKALDDTVPGFWVAVSYNPQAAAHVVNNQLLKQSVLNKYVVNGGIGSVPPFPDTAITTKPVYYVGHKGDQLIRIPAWPGQPTVPQAFGESSWNSYVYADVHNLQKPGRKLVPVTSSNPTPAQILAATCNLNDFINFKMDTVMAAYINQQQGPVQGVTAATGDIAILVAMHVTSREIHNWAWQTYYWAPNPDTPFLPSSNLAAKLRPKQLHGAASHYAVVTAYAEVLPNQPINGGTNTGVTPVIGYNPYLEATFGPATFAFPNVMNSKFQYGIQTNCMSCHALATMSPAAPYSTDQYISMNNPIFTNTVQLDFSWSMQAAIIPDVPPATGSTAKTKKK
jgi:hypothetical protein